MGKKKDKKKNVKDTRLTNQQLLERYKFYCRNKGMTERSIDGICDNDLRLFINFLGETSIHELTNVEIENFFAHCLNDRKNSLRTLERKYTSINQFINILIKLEIVDLLRNPMNKIEKPKSRRKVSEYLDVDEYKQMLKYAEKTGNLRNAALISLLFSSGIRVSEAHRVNRSSLDMQRRQFKILGKGQQERLCIFSEETKQRILYYLSTRVDNSDALFISKYKTRLSVKAIQEAVKTLGKRAGITKNIHPHIFRHGCGMALIKNNAPITTIQKVLGHSNVTTTQIYAHMNLVDLQDSVDAIYSNILDA